MKRLVALLGVLSVVGCGGSTVVLPTVPPGGLPTLPAGIPTLPPGFTVPPINLPSLPPGGTAAPTTSLIQVVNLYVPGDEPPFGFDIYLNRTSPFGGFAPAGPAEGDQPIAHADFGAVTAPFDPGALDQDEAWAAYRAGVPPTQDTLVWNFSSRVVDNGRFTVVVSSAKGFDPAAKHFEVSVSYRNDLDPGQGQTLAPTTGTLIVDNSGLDAVWGTASEKVNFVQAGDKCLDYPQSPGQPQPASLGGPTTFVNPGTGSVPITVFSADPDATSCTGSPSAGPVTADIPVGGFGYVFVYSTNINELKSFFVAPVH